MEIQALIQRAQGGDANSFAELLDLHYDTLYRFAWKWCGHKANAQDIAQLAAIKLASSLGQYRFEAAFSSWLYRLVVSCAHDWQRGQQRHEHELLSDDEPAAHAEQTEDGIYLAQILAQLDSLGEGMKDTALLVHAEGLSHAEAGAVLGVSESTISWRVHTIRRQLAKRDSRTSALV